MSQAKVGHCLIKACEEPVQAEKGTLERMFRRGIQSRVICGNRLHKGSFEFIQYTTPMIGVIDQGHV